MNKGSGKVSDSINLLSNYVFEGVVHLGGGIAFMSFGNEATAEVVNHKFTKAFFMVLRFSVV